MGEDIPTWDEQGEKSDARGPVFLMWKSTFKWMGKHHLLPLWNTERVCNFSPYKVIRLLKWEWFHFVSNRLYCIVLTRATSVAHLTTEMKAVQF